MTTASNDETATGRARPVTIEDDDGTTWVVETEWVLNEPTPVLHAFTVSRGDGVTDALTWTRVRGLGLAEVFREIRDEWHRQAALASHPDTSSRLREKWKGLPVDTDPPTRRQSWTTSMIERAARVYVAAVEEGEPARQAVADAFGVSGDRASRVIRQARDDGFIVGEVTPGKQSGKLSKRLREAEPYSTTSNDDDNEEQA